MVLLSNHGGRHSTVRQCRCGSSRKWWPRWDRAEVWVDTGVTNGADIVVCMALGADLVLVGRAYLYGLIAGGERGVDRAAEILTREVARTMRLLGATRIADLTPESVQLPAIRRPLLRVRLTRVLPQERVSRAASLLILDGPTAAQRAPERVAAMPELTGVASHAVHRSDELSSGQQQRVGSSARNGPAPQRQDATPACPPGTRSHHSLSQSALTSKAQHPKLLRH